MDEEKTSPHPRHKRPSNRIFAEKYQYTGEYQVPTSIEVTHYNENFLETKTIPDTETSFKKFVREDCINWFYVTGLTNSDRISEFAREIGVPLLYIRDVLSPGHVVKIDAYPDNLCFILNSCFFKSSKKMSLEHIGIFVTRNIVITFQEDRSTLFEVTREALKENTLEIRKYPSGALLAFLLNSFFSVQSGTANYLEKRLEDIEDSLLNEKHKQPHVGVIIQKCRHAHLILQKNIFPLRNQFSKLQQLKEGIITEKMLPIYDDLADQLEYTIQTAKNSLEILSSLLDLYISKNDFRTNAIMKHLTVVATIFIPATFLVGIWGMNFKGMPELDWPHGYLFAWVIILGVAVGTWFLMKRKQWF